MTPKAKRDWLTPREFAERVHVHEVTIRRWRSEGTGPKYLKVGGIRYPIEAVEEWEAARLLSSTAQNRSTKSATAVLPRTGKRQ